MGDESLVALCSWAHFFALLIFMSRQLFSTLPLSPALQQNLAQLGFSEMTPIQAESLPLILEGHDLIAQAKTGSGKTAAFGLGILHKLKPARFSIQALVLCPTRELAGQVAEELRRLARAESNIKVLVLTGGVPMGRQVDSLAHGVHIVVGTPGRVLDHIRRGSIDLSPVETLVLDEADRMVDMGFYDDMYEVVAACPPRRQSLMFSATYPDTIRSDAAHFLHEPIEVKVESLVRGSQIEQLFFDVEPDERYEATAHLLSHYQPDSALAFCNTKAQCDGLTHYLRSLGFSALTLHGDLEQRDRDEVLIQFANNSCTVLVATDVAARGLDISALAAVINVDMPRDPEVYIHRIGRTGRAQEKGLALSLCTRFDGGILEKIESFQQKGLQRARLRSRTATKQRPQPAPMQTVVILGGKKDKLRPADILGALTGDAGLHRDQVGKINIGVVVSHVALERSIASQAVERLVQHGIKKKRFRMHLLQTEGF